tara:strand:- start:397 stop:753 length:357 start_codon:yes stop_codon:yes gene_type:complete
MASYDPDLIYSVVDSICGTLLYGGMALAAVTVVGGFVREYIGGTRDMVNLPLRYDIEAYNNARSLNESPFPEIRAIQREYYERVISGHLQKRWVDASLRREAEGILEDLRGLEERLAA